MAEKKYVLKFYVNMFRKMEVSEKDQVDFRKVSNIENVIKDQLIAEVVPYEAGKDYSDRSEFLIIEKREDVISLFSDEFYIDEEDPSKIYAKISGRIFEEHGKFRISDKLEVKNVDFSTGNIYFVGDIKVKGDIKSGFTVKARNVFVEGSIDNAKVIAGEKIVVKGGVVGLQGKFECFLKADKMIVLNFVENSHIECEGPVYIRKSSMHTNIFSSDNIVVEESPGCIVGGEIISKRNIFAKVVGSKWGTHTILKAGIDPFKYLRLRELLAKKEKREKLLEEVDKSLAYLNEVLESGKGTEEEKEELKAEIEEIKEKKSQLQKRLKRLNNLIESLKKRIDEEESKENLSDSKIFVYERVYPGVEIRLGLDHHRVGDIIEGKTCFYLEDGKVKIKEISEQES